MAFSFIDSYSDIDWMRTGESGTGNTLNVTDVGYPSGVLNRPVKQVFENTLSLNIRVSSLESSLSDAFSPFAVSSSSSVSNASTDDTYLVLGSSICSAESALTMISSSSHSTVSGSQSSIQASHSCVISPTAVDARNNVIFSSDSCSISGSSNSSYSNSIFSSSDCTIEGIDPVKNVIAGSDLSSISESSNHSLVLASSRVKLEMEDYVIAGGYNVSGGASTANVTWKIDSKTGDISSKGVMSSGVSFEDFAEMFESVDGSVIEVGYLVTLDGDKIRKAKESDDYILGAVSKTAGVVLGSYTAVWSNKYIKDEFGGFTEEVNPEYDDSLEYVPRNLRDEWHIIGMIGKLHVRCDKSVSVGDYIKSNNKGIAKGCSKPTSMRVMKIVQEYSKELGYGVALVIAK